MILIEKGITKRGRICTEWFQDASLGNTSRSPALQSHDGELHARGATSQIRFSLCEMSTCLAACLLFPSCLSGCPKALTCSTSAPLCPPAACSRWRRLRLRVLPAATTSARWSCPCRSGRRSRTRWQTRRTRGRTGFQSGRTRVVAALGEIPISLHRYGSFMSSVLIHPAHVVSQ